MTKNFSPYGSLGFLSLGIDYVDEWPGEVAVFLVDMVGVDDPKAEVFMFAVLTGDRPTAIAPFSLTRSAQ